MSKVLHKLGRVSDEVQFHFRTSKGSIKILTKVILSILTSLQKALYLKFSRMPSLPLSSIDANILHLAKVNKYILQIMYLIKIYLDIF